MTNSCNNIQYPPCNCSTNWIFRNPQNVNNFPLFLTPTLPTFRGHLLSLRLPRTHIFLLALYLGPNSLLVPQRAQPWSRMDAMDIESKLSDVTVTAIPLGGNKRESSSSSSVSYRESRSQPGKSSNQLLTLYSSVSSVTSRLRNCNNSSCCSNSMPWPS